MVGHGTNGQKLQPSVKSGTGTLAVGRHQKGYLAVKHEAPVFYLSFLGEIRSEPGVSQWDGKCGQ